MKNFVIAHLLCSIGLIVTSAIGMENSNYSRDELLRARIRWFGQEGRIGQLRFEAKHIVKNKPVDYFNGNVFVAAIDAQTETIKTFIEPNKSIDLSYYEFDRFVRDAELYNEAVRYEKSSKGF
jgi:hypothetical protein